MPNISLIISAYNEEKYIGKCLESILSNPKNSFFEIIVINNSSTDRTEEVAKSFQGVHVFNEPEKGVMHARNRGFKEAKGDLIAFIDADTTVPATWFETIVKEFEGDPELVLLSGPFVYDDIPRTTEVLVNFYWKIIAVPVSHVVGYMAVFGNMIIRKDVLEKMGGLNTKIEFYGDDTDTARRASRFGKVKFRSDFIMHSSSRRLAQQGLLSASTAYMINYLSQVFIHRSVTKHSKEFR